MPNLDLSSDHLRVVLEELDKYVPEAEVWACGSRVRGQSHPGSDLDLVVRNPGDLDRPQPGISLLRSALRESDLPFLVEVIDWARLSPAFRDETSRAYVLIRPALASPARRA